MENLLDTDSTLAAAAAIPPLWEHQRQAIERATNRFALFFDPGCGKSRTVIEIWRKANPLPAKTIIFTPLNVCRNWENELRLYAGCDYSVYVVAGQSRVKKIAMLTAFVSHTGPMPAFLICNIETLRKLEYRHYLTASKSSFLILDESHNFKSPDSHQTKGLLVLIRLTKPTHLYLLTGTPCPQGEIDLYTTFLLLGKITENFFMWRKRYFNDKNEARRGGKNYWPEYVVTPAGKAQLRELLQECSMSAKKDLVLDLPELVRTNLYAEMSPAQKKCYESMKEYLFAIDHEGNELNAANMLTRTLRLQQILAGFLGDVEISHEVRVGGLGWRVQRNNRLVALGDAIALMDGAQFIVWTIFKATYGQIGKLLSDKNISFGLLTGEQTAQERFRNMEDFQAGKLRALVSHPRAGGVGVNLTAASFSVHYTRSYNLVDDLQSEARSYRGGSERHKRITRIDIITPETVDEDIAEALRAKKSVQDFILVLKAQHGK